MLVKLTSRSNAALIRDVVLYVVVKNLLRQLNLAIDIFELIYLRIVLITSYHHTLLCILH